jgi:hypothetical protein
VIVTAETRAQQAERVERAGANLMLLKPVAIHQIVGECERLLGGRWHRTGRGNRPSLRGGLPVGNRRRPIPKPPQDPLEVVRALFHQDAAANRRTVRLPLVRPNAAIRAEPDRGRQRSWRGTVGLLPLQIVRRHLPISPAHPQAQLCRGFAIMKTMYDLTQRVRAEYIEMPGLRLRAEQVQRLCGIEKTVCALVLEALLRDRFLAETDGHYVRASDDPAIRPVRAKAALKLSPASRRRRDRVRRVIADALKCPGCQSKFVTRVRGPRRSRCIARASVHSQAGPC